MTNALAPDPMPANYIPSEALEAFWAVIADQHPEFETGDLSPLTSLALTTAANQAVSEWVQSNLPTKTYLNEADGHTYWLSKGELWAAPTFNDGKPDIANCVYADDFDDPMPPGEKERVRSILKAMAG